MSNIKGISTSLYLKNDSKKMLEVLCNHYKTNNLSAMINYLIYSAYNNYINDTNLEVNKNEK